MTADARDSAAATRISENFLHHLGQAIRIRTVGHDDPTLRDEDAFSEFHRFLRRTYPNVWESLSPERVADHSLLFTWESDNPTAPPILLIGHFDVVPVESPDAWDVEPFAGEIRDGHLYGRGTLDDKGSVIALFEAVEALLTEDFAPSRTVVVAIGHDEETTGLEGAVNLAALLADRNLRFEMVLDEGGFVSEGTVPFARKPVALIGIGEKGYMDVEMTATGDPGHSSYPPSTTAVGRVAAAIAAVESHPMPARVEVQAPFFRAASRAASPLMRRVLKLLPNLGRVAERVLSSKRESNALIRTTLAATTVSGGTKANVLPTSAKANVNVRILPGDSTADVIAHIRSLAGEDVEVRARGASEPSRLTDVDGDAFQTVARVVERIFPDAVVAPWITIGATDARHYERVADSAIRFSPFRVDKDSASGFHGPNERIRLDAGVPAVTFYREIITTFAG